MINKTVGKRIGLMGGSFNPIHFGHLMLAEQIRTTIGLDEVIFVPVGNPPHKALQTDVTSEQRYEMVKLAIADNPFFSVSDIEIKREGISYTIDTIKELKSTLSSIDQLYFITGADAILLLETWKDYKELTQLVKFIGATRPGIDSDALLKKITQLKSECHAEIELVYIPALAISSTDIRSRISDEKSIRYLMPESVTDYIYQHFLYREHHELFAPFFQMLSQTLSKKRFRHSVETAHTARLLAIRYGEDPVKAELAGLLHDLAKEYKNEKMRDLIDEFGIDKDPAIVHLPNLAHGEVAAGILKRDYHFDDELILEAIKWHTYGHPQISSFSKLIYVADIIEPSRDFEGVHYFRRLAYQNIDETIIAFCEQCDHHLAEKQMAIHGNSKKMVMTLLNQRKNDNE